MKSIALIGSGALARHFSENLGKLLGDDYFISGVLCRDINHAHDLADDIGCASFHNLDELLAVHPDFVVEFASAEAVRDYGETILKSGSNLVIVSLGALIDIHLRASLITAAKQGRTKLYIPSGAIGGYDLMRVFSLMGNAKAKIESCKNPSGINGAPYLQGRVLSSTESEEVFSGTPQEAIKGFPKNVNVAVATSIVSNIPGTRVVLRSDPSTNENTHCIHLENPSMKATITVSASPEPTNPRSSMSTSWSVIALLQNLVSPISYF